MIQEYFIDEIDEVYGINNDGSVEFYSEEAVEFSLNGSQENSEVTGKNGRLISMLRRNKKTDGSLKLGMINGGLLGAMTGSKAQEIVTGQVVKHTDIKVKASSNTATTEFEADGDIKLYKRNSDGTTLDLANPFKMVSTTPSNDDEFKYDASTKTITFKEDAVADGTELVAIYDRTLTTPAMKVGNESDEYSKTVYLICNCSVLDRCDNQYSAQIIVPRCFLTGEFSMGAGTDDKSLTANWQAMSGGCGTSKNYWDMIVF